MKGYNFSHYDRKCDELFFIQIQKNIFFIENFSLKKVYFKLIDILLKLISYQISLKVLIRFFIKHGIDN